MQQQHSSPRRERSEHVEGQAKNETKKTKERSKERKKLTLIMLPPPRSPRCVRRPVPSLNTRRPRSRQEHAGGLPSRLVTTRPLAAHASGRGSKRRRSSAGVAMPLQCASWEEGSDTVHTRSPPKRATRPAALISAKRALLLLLLFSLLRGNMAAERQCILLSREETGTGGVEGGGGWRVRGWLGIMFDFVELFKF